MLQILTILFLVSGIFCEIQFPLDRFSQVPQIIKRHGYRVESHIVTTDDGYMLTLIRIPGSKNGHTNKQPVLLEHTAMADSSCFVLNGKQSLGKYNK